MRVLSKPLHGEEEGDTSRDERKRDEKDAHVFDRGRQPGGQDAAMVCVEEEGAMKGRGEADNSAEHGCVEEVAGKEENPFCSGVEVIPGRPGVEWGLSARGVGWMREWSRDGKRLSLGWEEAVRRPNEK